MSGAVKSISNIGSDIGGGLRNAVGSVGNVIKDPSFSNIRNLAELGTVGGATMLSPSIGPIPGGIPMGLMSSGGAENTLRQIGGAELIGGGLLAGGAGLGFGAGGAEGGDLFGGFAVDPMTGDVIGGGVGGGLDPMTGLPMSGGGPMEGFTVDPNTGDVIPSGGPGGAGSSGGGLNLGSLLGAGRSIGGLLSKLGGGVGGILGAGLGGPGGPSIANMAPGLAALAYARNQPGLDTGKLENVFQQAGVNAPLFTQAAINPVQQNISGGYGDLLQSQGLRNIRGSSFGDQDIANYQATTGRALGDVGANAAQQALGLQGNLAGNIAQLQNQAQQQKNQLYGRAFDMLGRGLNPGMSLPGLTAPGGIPGMGGGSGLQIPGMPSMPNLFGGGSGLPASIPADPNNPVNFTGGDPSQFGDLGGNIDPSTGFGMGFNPMNLAIGGRVPYKSSQGMYGYTPNNQMMVS